MPRHETRRTPKVMSGVLYTDDQHTGIRLDSPAWFAWLGSGTTFYYQSPFGALTARYERRRRGGRYWVAYHRQAGVLRRTHLGKSDHLTAQCLDQAVLLLNPSPGVNPVAGANAAHP